MTREERRRIDRLTAISGLPPIVVDFAIFNGFRLGSEDQDLHERKRDLMKTYRLTSAQALVLVGESFRDEVDDFFATRFPVIERNRR